jgi:hypothetical protein
VTKHQKKIDLKPFQAKAQVREDTLTAHYRRLGIPEVVAALQQKSERPATASSDEQMR